MTTQTVSLNTDVCPCGRTWPVVFTRRRAFARPIVVSSPAQTPPAHQDSFCFQSEMPSRRWYQQACEE